MKSFKSIIGLWLQGVGGGAGWLVDPFSLVADEVAQLGDRMREMVINEVSNHVPFPNADSASTLTSPPLPPFLH